MTIEDLIVRVSKLKYDDAKVIELSTEEYTELMVWIGDNQDKPILHGDTGWDTKKDCYVFAGCEIRRAA